MNGEYSSSLDNPCRQISDFEEKIRSEITFDEVKDAFPVFVKKVAIKNYPKRASAEDPKYSTGTHFIACETAEALTKLLRKVVEKADDPTVTAAAGELLLNAWLDMVRIGPHMTHVQIMGILASDSKPRIKDYVPTLPPEKIATVLKALDISLQCPKVEDDPKEFAFKFRCRLAEVYDNFTANQLAAVQSELLDVSYNYHMQLTTLPADVADEMKYTIWCLGEKSEYKNPYANLKHVETYKKHITMIKYLVCSDAMGEDTPLVDTTYMTLRLIFKVLTEDKGTILDDVFDHLMKTLVEISKHPRGRKYGRRIYDCYDRRLFEVMKDQGKVPSDAVFKSCQHMVSEVLTSGEVSNDMESMVRKAQDGVIKKIEQNPATKANSILMMAKDMLLSGKKDLIGKAKEAIDNAQYGKKVKVFVWKNLVPEAIMLIDVVGKQPVDKIDDDKKGACRDMWWTINEYKSFMDKLLDILRKGKVVPQNQQIQIALVECIFNCLECPCVLKAGIAAQCVDDKYLDVSTVNGKLVTDMLQRLLKLLENTDLEWHNMHLMRTTKGVLSLIMSSYFGKGNAMTGEHNKLLLAILATCGEGDSIEDQFYQEEEPDHTSVYYEIYTDLFSSLVNVHQKNKTDEWLTPAIPDLMKWASISSEEEHTDVMQSMSRIMYSVVSAMPTLLKDYLPQIMAMFIDVEDNTNLLWYCVNALYLLNPKPVHSRLQDIFTMMEERDNNTKQLMISLLHTISQKHPEVFTKDHVSRLLKLYRNNDQVNVSILMIIKEVANVNTKFVAPHYPTLIDDKIFKPASLVTRAGILACIGRVYEKYGTGTIDYLMKFVGNKDQTAALSALTSVRRMMAKHVDYMQKYRTKLQTLEKTDINPDIKDVSHQMVLVLDGISIEEVFEDVKQQQEDIDELDTKVDATIDTVNTIGEHVVDHHYKLKGVRKDIDEIEERVDDAEDNIEETKAKVEEIDNKTMTNAPKWSRDLTKLMNPKTDNDWRLLASRLGYSNTDIRGWAQQNDPCMALLSEWYATHKTSEASHGVLTALYEMNRIDGAAIVENAMKAADGVVEDEEFEYASPPSIFLSYQWGMQDEVKLLQRHLNMAGYECWMDIGQMGGGDKLFAKIDNGIRAAKVVICCVTEKYAQSPNCNREVNLSVNLGKSIIPLLMEKMNWPPKGSMGPIFSEYLFIRFFQRGDEETSDQRYWPVPKFQELLMQLNCYAVPDSKLIKKAYKDWWKPMAEEIVIDKKKSKTNTSQVQTTTQGKERAQPLVFLSYQWGKQPQIKNLYQRLTNLGYTVWMDIYQMGGGDSLYDKIDRGLRGCKAVVSCVTTKYSLSANCRREVSLADALKKPIVPLLLEQMKWPPDGPMSMVFTELLYINCYRDADVQMSWKGPTFHELKGKLQEHIPELGHINAIGKSDKGISGSGSTVGYAKSKPATGHALSQTNKTESAVVDSQKPEAKTAQRTNRNTIAKTIPAKTRENENDANASRPKSNTKVPQGTARSIAIDKSPATKAKAIDTDTIDTATNSIPRPIQANAKPVTKHMNIINSDAENTTNIPIPKSTKIRNGNENAPHDTVQNTAPKIQYSKRDTGNDAHYNGEIEEDKSITRSAHVNSKINAGVKPNSSNKTAPQVKPTSARDTENNAQENIINAAVDTSQRKPVRQAAHMNTKDNARANPNSSYKLSAQVIATSVSKESRMISRQHPAYTGATSKNDTMASPTGKSEAQAGSKSCILL